MGEFEVLSLLGVGGFGMVYQAFDHSLLRSVAIKEYIPASLAGRAPDLSVAVRALADVPAFEAGLRSFIGEARMLAQFDHPSLVKVFRFWEAHHTAYMVMPLYRGMTLKQARLQMRTPPPEAWLRQVLWSVLGALRTLHHGNTLHRDISPDNIFLQDVGPPVLLDLGAARQAINNREHKHTAVLKVNYAPIEQYASGDADLPQGPWSDLYSLAAVVYGCLCNNEPDPSTLRAIRDRMVPFARVARTVGHEFGQIYSPAFVNAITQALALQPQQRPQSIEAFLQLLEMDSAPAPMQHFDFRAALGNIWVEPTDQPNATAIPTVHLTSPKAVNTGPIATSTPSPSNSYPMDDARDTMLLEDVQDTMLLHGPDTVLQDDTFPESIGLESHWPERSSLRPGESAPTPTAAQPRRAWVKWAGVAAVVAVMTAGMTAAYTTYTHRSPVKAASSAEQNIITEIAEPAPKPALPAPAIEPTAVVEAAPIITEAAPEAAPPAFVEKTDPRALSQNTPKPIPARKLPPAPPPATAVPEPTVPPANSPAPTPTAPPPSAPKPATSTVCADSSALTRSMCLRSECRQPAFAKLPVCVEFRKQMEPLEVHSHN